MEFKSDVFELEFSSLVVIVYIYKQICVSL